MPLYAKIKRDLSAILSERVFVTVPPAAGNIASNKPYWVLVNVVVVDNSTGPNTTDDGVVEAILATEVTRTRTIRDKTTQELNADEVALIASLVDGPLGQILLDQENSIRDNRNPSESPLTLAQYKTQLESLF